MSCMVTSDQKPLERVIGSCYSRDGSEAVARFTMPTRAVLTGPRPSRIVQGGAANEWEKRGQSLFSCRQIGSCGRQSNRGTVPFLRSEVGRYDRRVTAREKRLWGLAALWLLLIYSTLSLVRAPITYLRDQNLLRLAVALVFLLAATVVLVVLVRRRPGRREWAVLGGFLVLYLAAMAVLELPEERLHLLEYGVFAGLVYSALLERRFPGDSAVPPAGSEGLRLALAAVLVTLAAGWIDEGIQGVLPERYYDNRDVFLNGLAGLLAVGAMRSTASARRRDRS